MIAFPFFGIIFAIFEVAYVTFENELLAGAVNKAVRAMLTGQTQGAAIDTTAKFVSTYLCPTTGARLLPSSFDCNKLIVDVRTVTSFASGDMSKSFYTSSTNKFCPGAAGQIVAVRVAYPLPAILPLNLYSGSLGTVSNVPGLPGKYHILLGAALFQEEQFSVSYTAPSGC